MWAHHLPLPCKPACYGRRRPPMTVGTGGHSLLRFLPLLRRPVAIIRMSSDAVKAGAETDKAEVRPEVAEEEPPEKPLPGDCCGSGCVRCVWDVYYDELEEYNNRRKKALEDSKSRK